MKHARITPQTPAEAIARARRSKPNEAALRNELRRAERDWQRHAEFDHWHTGNPWAAHRDEAAARYASIKGQLAELRL